MEAMAASATAIVFIGLFSLLHTHGGYGSQCNSYCLYWFIHLAFVFMN